MQTDRASVHARIVAAFVDERQGGNLAGVVLERPDLGPDEMQSVAAAIGLSETAFVREVPGGYFVDFFTPRKRIADCGHATVAAFQTLVALGRLAPGETTKFITTGARPIRAGTHSIAMLQPFAAITPLDAPPVADALGIAVQALRNEPVIARHDVAFVLVGLRSLEALRGLQPDFDAIATITRAHDAIGFYVFAEPSVAVDATARMFAPGFGIREESATGTAAGLLTAYLYERGNAAQTHFHIEQGAFMQPPSPSSIASSVESRDGERVVWVEGRAEPRRSLDVLLAT